MIVGRRGTDFGQEVKTKTQPIILQQANLQVRFSHRSHQATGVKAFQEFRVVQLI